MIWLLKFIKNMCKGKHLLLKHWETVIQKQRALFGCWVEGWLLGSPLPSFSKNKTKQTKNPKQLWILRPSDGPALVVADCIRYHPSKLTLQSSKFLNQQLKMPSPEFSFRKLSKIPLHTLEEKQLRLKCHSKCQSRSTDPIYWNTMERRLEREK